jgi:hypothetical protein
LADSAAVEQPNPVSHLPPKSIDIDFELAEMMAPMLIVSVTAQVGLNSHEQSVSVCHRVSSTDEIGKNDVGEESANTTNSVDTLED